MLVELCLRRHGVGGGEQQHDARQHELVQVVLLVQPRPHGPQAVHGAHRARVLAQREVRLQRLAQRLDGVHVLVRVAVKERDALVHEARGQVLVEGLHLLGRAQLQVRRAHHLAALLQEARRLGKEARRVHLFIGALAQRAVLARRLERRGRHQVVAHLEAAVGGAPVRVGGGGRHARSLEEHGCGGGGGGGSGGRQIGVRVGRVRNNDSGGAELGWGFFEKGHAPARFRCGSAAI